MKHSLNNLKPTVLCVQHVVMVAVTGWARMLQWELDYLIHVAQYVALVVKEWFPLFTTPLG